MLLNYLLLKILWFKRSKWQFFMAGFAFLFGLLLVLISMELWLDIKSVSDAKKKKGDYVIINKKVTLSNTLGLATSEFTQKDIDTIEQQPFIKSVGSFESNQFQAAIRTTQFVNLYTFVFFESVPDEFIDEKPSEWKWKPGASTLPIILSTDFLNMYNFGFALGQGLPQVSKEAIKMVPIDVIISDPSGNKKDTLEGRILGFSSRISSVLVPYKFMRWANSNYGSNSKPLPNRLALKVTGTDDPGLSKFLEKRKYQTNEDKLLSGKTGTLLNILLTGIGILGVFFIFLSFLLFSLNFRVILAEATPEIKLLLELGYKEGTIVYHLVSFFVGYIVILTGIDIFLLLYADSKVISFINNQGFSLESGISLLVWQSGFLFIIGLILINLFLIFNQFNKRFFEQ